MQFQTLSVCQVLSLSSAIMEDRTLVAWA